MYLLTAKNCQKCKMLRNILGDLFFSLEIRDAENEMDFCRKVGLKSVPALVINEDEFTTDLDEIVRLVEEKIKG